jgi:hypothetical protein
MIKGRKSLLKEVNAAVGRGRVAHSAHGIPGREDVRAGGVGVAFDRIMRWETTWKR